MMSLPFAQNFISVPFWFSFNHSYDNDLLKKKAKEGKKERENTKKMERKKGNLMFWWE